MTLELDRELLRIGAVQFGQFEARPGVFQPVAINLRLVPSYPPVLAALADALAPLVSIDGLTHLLPMPGIVPLGAAVSLATGLPLVYPAPDDPQAIEGAYDYNVPTILLTDVLTDGLAEGKMIRRARKQGLDVEVVVAVFYLGAEDDMIGSDTLPRSIGWRRAEHLLSMSAAQSPHLATVVQEWLVGFSTAK